MLVFLKFTNAEDLSNSYTWQNENDDGFLYVAPLNQLDIRIDERTVTDRYRMQKHGTHQVFPYHGGMHLDLTGDLFKDSSEDYITERKTMISALRGVPDTQPTERRQGILEVEWAGEDESAKTDVIIEQISMPIVALYPAQTTFMITFFSFLPWFVGSDSGDLYYFA